MTRQIPWLRVFVEGVVIVGSILMAFVLEGWRDDAELRRELRQELVSVQVELERNHELINAGAEALARVLAGSNSLLDRMGAAEGVGDIMVPDTVAWLATGWNPTLNASLGAIDALIASGRLAQIGNAQLRSGLAGLKYEVEDAVEDEEQARLITVEQLVPLIRDHVDMRATFGVGVEFLSTNDESAGQSTQQIAVRRAIPSEGAVSFPNTPGIRSTIRYRSAWWENARAEMGRLRASVEGLLLLLEQEIG